MAQSRCDVSQDLQSRDDIYVVAALALAPAVGLGISRFAYALILPAMRADLGWTYADAGWLNTTNAIGYLIGALVAARVISVAGAFRVVIFGSLACVVALALCAVTQDFNLLNIARFLTGLGGAFAFVAGGVMATKIAQNHAHRASFLLGLFYAGPGLGILISGIGLPLILARQDPQSWHAAWMMLAVLSLLLTAGLWKAKRSDDKSFSAAQTGAPLGKMKLLLSGYLIFGTGYIAYMTFMIAWIQSKGASTPFEITFWTAIGIGAIASPWLWAHLLKRQAHGHAFAILTGITATGAALPLLMETKLALLASALLFGSAFFAVVASTTSFVRRNLARASWASGIAALTVTFGIGQTVGPIAAGALNDLTGGLASGLWGSTALLVAAASIGLLQRDFGSVKDAPG